MMHRIDDNGRAAGWDAGGGGRNTSIKRIELRETVWIVPPPGLRVTLSAYPFISETVVRPNGEEMQDVTKSTEAPNEPA